MKKLLKRFIILFIIIEGVYFFTANYSNAINEEDLPEFYGTTSITIKKGDTLDLKKSYYRIFAKDKIDGNITKNIQVVKNNVNTNVSGNYTIEYKVSNSRGKTTNLSVPVHVISNGERKIERTLYILPDISYMNNAGFYRGNMQDAQNLGFYLPAGVTVKAKQVNKNCKSSVFVSLYNDDNLTESANVSVIFGLSNDYDIATYDNRKEIKSDNDNYTDLQNVTKIKRKLKSAEDKEDNWKVWNEYNNRTYDSVPMVKTIYATEEKPVIEIILNDNIKELDYFTYGDDEQNFKNKWKNSRNHCGIIEGDRVQFLVPYKDLEELGISKKGKYNNYKHDNFTTVQSILKYYDNVVETYDNWIGLSYESEEYYNKNVKTKFLIKPIIHAGNILAAYSYREYIYMSSDSLDVFLHNEGSGWAPLHEIGHGYQGSIKYFGDLYLGEVSNNFLAYYYQKANLSGEDWLAEYNGNEIMNLVRNTNESFLKKYNNPSTQEETTGVNDYKLKLFAYINILNKIGMKEALSNTYSYCRYLTETKGMSNKTAIDIIVKGFSDGTGYNVIPYFEDWKLEISEYVKKEIYNKNYPIVYYIRDLVSSDSEAQSIKNRLNYPWNFSVVENKDINYLGYTGALKINLSDEQINALSGSQILLKSGNNIIKQADINSKMITFSNIPIGVYEVETDNKNYLINNCYVVISKEKTNQKNIDITKKELVEIQIKKQPLNIQYVEGEDFDEDGMVVEAVYSNGMVEEINNYSILNGKNLKLDQENVIISYTLNGVTKKVIQKITVIEKVLLRIESGKYDITDDMFIKNITPNTTIHTFKNGLETNGSIKIYKDTYEITNEDKLITTGMEMVVTLNNEKSTYKVVVVGDLIGNGKMDNVNLLKLARYIAKIDLNLNGPYLKAADIYSDGKYGDIKDLLKMSRVLAKIENI